jgi:hypothetical protein
MTVAALADCLGDCLGDLPGKTAHEPANIRK